MLRLIVDVVLGNAEVTGADLSLLLMLAEAFRGLAMANRLEIRDKSNPELLRTAGDEKTGTDSIKQKGNWRQNGG